MKNPRPVNLTTDDELRNLGWWAVARDRDGHLISMICDGAGDKSVADFFREAAEDGLSAYILSAPVHPARDPA